MNIRKKQFTLKKVRKCKFSYCKKSCKITTFLNFFIFFINFNHLKPKSLSNYKLSILRIKAIIIFRFYFTSDF